MKTMQAEYETVLERIAGENRAALERLERRMAERETSLERTISGRDKWLYGLLISVLVAVVLILIRQYLPLPAS